MASEAPSAIDVADIQFKLNSKFNLIQQEVNENKGNLLAAASVYGLVIVGSSEPCLKVIQLSRIVSDKDKAVIPSRSIPLPVPPHTIALSCDHSMLAVNFKQNEISFVTIFSVPSFLSSNIRVIHQNIRLCTDNGVTASQLLWNPVQATTLAVCLSNKSLLVFSFKEQGYDFYSIDKSEQVGCASWSPKGKQIVAGFSNGKIAQYKPDLKLARTIPCTVLLYQTPWDVIALQWLSTYQFAAVMLPKVENAVPALFIVYAPKNGTATYTNYSDVCFSQTGPRSAQIILTHILPWNLLLVISANGTEVGVLGTTETGDNPLWKQYLMLDEARAELPLTPNQIEMFPLGIDVDTGTTHHLVIDENQLPVMAMLHMLSTHGILISFNVLNMTANCPTISSPPQLVPDSSGINSFTIALPPTNVSTVTPPKNDISFNFPAAVTSTPRVPQKMISISNPNEAPKVESASFQNAAPAEPVKAFSNLFGGQTTIQPIASSQSAFSFVPKSTEALAVPSSNPQTSQTSIFGISQASKTQIPAAASVPLKPNSIHTAATIPAPRPENNKPFITVAPTFSQPPQSSVIEKGTRLQTAEENTISDDEIIKKMIREEAQSYDTLAKTFLKRCKSVEVFIGSKEESQGMLKELMELQDISNQATESTDALSLDIQSLKVSLNETYLMIAELKSKHSLLNDANYSQLNDANSMSHTSRRQLEKLEKLLSVNENQYRIVSQQINAHWSSYEENKKKNTRAKMHVPSLENIYQTLTKQRDIISRQRIKINHIKSRLGYKDNVNQSKKTSELNISSLTDSMVSMSLCDQVKFDTERLSTEKLNSLRDMLKSRKILQISPKRPERTGLSSEIVIEKRRAQERIKASIAKTATTHKTSNIQPTPQPPQLIANAVPKYGLPDAGFQLSKSTSKSELSGILKSTKTNSKVLLNKENSDSAKHTVSFALETKPKVENTGFVSRPNDKTVSVKGFTATDNAPPFSAKPTTISFGNTISEKPATSFGTGLFNNIGTPSFGANNTQSSVLFGSNTPTPIPFGSQSSNAITIQKKSESTTKPDKAASPAFDVNVVQLSATAPKTADKENVHKIEVPKPVLGGIIQEKIDTVQKPTAIQSILSNFGIASSVTVAANSNAPALPFGTIATTKDSSTAFNTINSNQSNEATKSSFSIPLATGPTKPNIATSSATVSTVVNSSSNSDFSFSLDKMGITPKTTTATTNALQKPLFNLDPKIDIAVASNVTSLGDTENQLENLTFCKPTVTNNDQASPSGGNIFSMASFSTPTKSENVSSIFGGNAAAKSPFSNFGNITAPTTPTTQPSVFASPFSSPNVTVSTASANVPFYGKPDQSSFGQQKPNSVFGGTTTSPSTNVFGGTATTQQSSSVFGGNATTQSSSVFGGNAFIETPSSTTTTFGANQNTFGTPTSNSFGVSTTNTFGTPTTNAFGSSTTTSNIFGNSAGSGFGNAGNAFSSTKSIFGGGGAAPDQTPAFGSTGGSLFGASNAAAPTSPFGQTASQSTGSLFGGSSFGSGAQPSTGSIFGGASTGSTGFGQSTFGNSSFSQQSSPFASNTAGAFSQSPQATASSGFGGNPTFGGQPTFGAAATFGSPKSGFGSFANVPTAAFGTSPTQQNSLFESLGSSDTGLSFGNIAQNSNASAPKPSFGGGSFSSWR